MKMNKKICVLVSTNIVGGHEYQLNNLIINRVQNGFNVDVVCNNAKIGELFSKSGINIIINQIFKPGKLYKQILYSLENVLFFKNLRKYNEIIVSGGSIEAVISCGLGFLILGQKKYLKCYVPMYIDRSIQYGKLGVLYNLFINLLVRTIYTEIITVNRIQQLVLRSSIGINVTVFKNTISPVEVPKISKGKRIVYIGRFDNKQKNLIEMINKLDSPRNPYSHLYVIGDGPDRIALEEAASKTNKLKVVFLGWYGIQGQNQFLGLDDLLVMNSLWEGEPLIIREFKQRGLAVLVPDIIGFKGITKKSERFISNDDFYKKLNINYNNVNNM